MIEPRPEVEALPPYRPGRPEGLEAGAPVVNLAANENAFGPSPAAAQSLASLPLHRYPDMAGQDLLPRLGRSLGLDAGELLLGTGSGHLIKCLAEAYLRPGDLVVVTHPTFSLYASDAALMGAKTASLPGDGHRVEFSRLPEFVRAQRPRLVFACSPNNPTGDAVDDALLAEIVAAIPGDGLLVVDEAYVHFADRPAQTLARVKAREPIAVLRTFSKAFGLAALRLGVLAAPPEVIAAVSRVREPFPASIPALVAATAAVEDEEHLSRVRRLVRAGRDRLSRELAARGLRINPGQGNFVWAEVPFGGGPPLVAALRSRGVLVRDGGSFGVPTHVRVTVGTDEELDRLLSALDDVRRD